MTKQYGAEAFGSFMEGGRTITRRTFVLEAAASLAQFIIVRAVKRPHLVYRL